MSGKSEGDTATPRVSIDHSVLRIGANNAPQLYAIGSADEMIGHDAFVSGIGDARIRRTGEQIIERGDVDESALALECFEERIRLNFCDVLIGVILEKLLAGDATSQASQHTEFRLVNVGNAGAVVFPGGLGIETVDGGEKLTGEFGIELRMQKHIFFAA